MGEHKYGKNPDAKAYVIGDNIITMDDKFVLATLVALLTVLEMTTPNISEAISTMAETIYEHIKEADTSELGQTGADTGDATDGSEADETA